MKQMKIKNFMKKSATVSMAVLMLGALSLSGCGEKKASETASEESGGSKEASQTQEKKDVYKRQTMDRIRRYFFWI